MEKEKWIDDILQSAKDIKAVASDPYLATKVTARLHSVPLLGSRMSLTSLYLSAVAVIVIVVMNIFVWKNSSTMPDKTGVQQLIQEYGLGNDQYTTNYSN